MQDDTDAARQGDHRAPRSPAAGNLCGLRKYLKEKQKFLSGAA
jgi:hypothetical protein